MEKLLLTPMSKPDLTERYQYIGDRIAVFDIYHKNRRKKKIFTGTLNDIMYQEHNLIHKTADSETQVIETTLCMAMGCPRKNPAIYYISDKFKIVEPSDDGAGFHIPIKKDGMKVEFTNSVDEFENKAREVAEKETLVFREFLDYSKQFF